MASNSRIDIPKPEASKGRKIRIDIKRRQSLLSDFLGSEKHNNDGDGSTGKSDGSAEQASGSHGRSLYQLVIVAKHLPLNGDYGDGDLATFSWKEDSFLYQLKGGFPEEVNVCYVGSLDIAVPPRLQKDLSEDLMKKFNCVPIFLPPTIFEKCHHIFCDRNLWPLLHNALPLFDDYYDFFDKSYWEAYVTANQLFCTGVLKVVKSAKDYVWIHDYHLMALPSFLRRRHFRLRMGFFLYTPFPSFEIFSHLSVREEILKSLLNCDVMGFQTYDYARNFLACCGRILGVDYQVKSGTIEVEYHGRNVSLRVLPTGIHTGHIDIVMKEVGEESWLRDLKQQFDGKTVLLGIDEKDIFKGINFKLLAMEKMLRQYPSEQGRAVLIQILSSSDRIGKGIYNDELDILEDLKLHCERINREYGKPGYRPIVIINRPMTIPEKFAYYSIAECFIVTSLNEGASLSPYEYIACREGLSYIPSTSTSFYPKHSMLVISEFLWYSSTLCGALCVNPWNVDDIAEKMHEAISMNVLLKESQHKRHYKYIQHYNINYWSSCFFRELDSHWFKRYLKKCWGSGFGFDFKAVFGGPQFTKLPVDIVIAHYAAAMNRVILLDYDGTLTPLHSDNSKPSDQIISVLNRLCEDKRNFVFIVSGRGKEKLNEWFGSHRKLGIAAEHGFFLRWPQHEEWNAYDLNADLSWMMALEPVMRLYASATNGSEIERKTTGKVWKYLNADTTFGSSQAKQMSDHLRSILANEPAVVKTGKFIVEVQQQEINKGVVTKKILELMASADRKADFILCIGDDNSDEDMFEMTSTLTRSIDSDDIFSTPPSSVYSCTIGQKASKALYYLENTAEVIKTLEFLASASRIISN